MVDYDPALLDRVFEAEGAVHVTAEMIRDFCAAIGDTNPLFTDPEAAKRGPYKGLVAPPAVAAGIRDIDNVFRHIPDTGRRLAAGMEVEFIAPIRAGDSIAVTSRIKEIYEKTGRTGTMTFIVIRATLKNQNGDVVAHIDHRFVNRS
jgi:acyl dehydratase